MASIEKEVDEKKKEKEKSIECFPLATLPAPLSCCGV